MRAASLAAFMGMMILAAGLAPAHAMPACAPITTALLAAAPPNLLLAKHHGRHWGWRHRRGGWSGVAPPYAPAPEIDASEAPALRYPPTVGLQQPPAPPPAQTMPNRSGAAAGSRPSIEWVNPDRAVR